jgi:NAD+ synthase
MFDANKEIENIIKWIREWFKENGPTANAVIGISGGKDSTIIAKLLVEALGKDRVIGVLMPNGIQNDINDSCKVVNLLGIKSYAVNIKNAYEGTLRSLEASGITPTDDTLINIAPRLRMTILYAVAQSLPNGGRVCNTCNKSEDYVGYSTKFGDSAGDFSPCSDYLVTEMLQLGDALGLPYTLVHKTPSDGLCGKTDEDNLGFTYAELDHYIQTGVIDDLNKKEVIDRKHKLNLHKLKPLPYYKR